MKSKKYNTQKRQKQALIREHLSLSTFKVTHSFIIKSRLFNPFNSINLDLAFIINDSNDQMVGYYSIGVFEKLERESRNYAYKSISNKNSYDDKDEKRNLIKCIAKA